MLAFIAACFSSLTNGHPQLEFRYLVNPLIAMALLGGVLAGDLTVMACSWMGTRVGSVLALLAGILLITPSLVRDVQLNQFLRRKDTRSIAREWMLAHAPRTDAIVLIGGETYGKPKLQGLYSHRFHAHTPDDLARLTRWANWIVADSFPPLGLWSEGPSDAEVDELNSEGTLVFDLDPIKAGAPTPAFDPNDAFYVPFNHITSMTRPGPRIRVWKITTERATH